MENSESVKRWLNAVHADHAGSDLTRDSYLRWLKRFVEWVGKAPDQLIEERKQQLKSEDEASKRQAEEALRDFCNYLEKEKHVSRGSVLAYHSAVKSFYKYNYLPLQLRTPKKHAAQGVNPHTHEEVKALYDVANVRDRAVILALAESGMSRADFVKLTYGDIKKDYERGNETIHMSVIRRKEQVKYDTFLGKNSAKVLKTYLEMRKRKGEQIEENTILFPSEGEDPTFTPTGLNWLLRRLGEKAGVTTSPHRFRKFFESNMGTKAPSLLVKYWMGHSLGVESSYFRPPIEEQRRAFLEAYDKIDIFKTEMSETTLELALGNLLMSLKGKTSSQQKEMVATYLESLTPQTRKAVETKLKTYGIDAILAKDDAKKDCKNGNCQKIVAESELEKWLLEGWQIVTVLASGKVVISND